MVIFVQNGGNWNFWLNTEASDAKIKFEFKKLCTTVTVISKIVLSNVASCYVNLYLLLYSSILLANIQLD